MDVPPISIGRVLTWWTFDALTTALVVIAAAAYLVGVRRLARRGRTWRPVRTISFLAGLGVLVFATQSGLARYEDVLFSTHVLQHLLLAMAAPILLALGAPVTLALQASRRHTQVFLLRLLHAAPVRVVTHPLFAWAVFGGTLFLLYFTDLYELTLRNDVVHAWLHIHFVVSGALFFWVLVGLDPSGWRIPYWARVLLVLLAVPFHAFLGVAILSSDQVLAADWYAEVGRTWGAPALDDQRTGGALLWVVGDLLGLVAGGVVVTQWVRHELRLATRVDRRLDRAQPV